MIQCYYYRKLISDAVDARRPLSARALKHLHRCGDCRAVFEMQSGVARSLSESAPAEESLPVFLHPRIMASLARPLPDSSPRGHRWKFHRGMAGAAVCAGLVCLAGLLFQHLAFPPAPRRVTVPVARSSEPSRTPVREELPAPISVREWAVKVDEPLETETKLVMNDTQTAMNALAENFLPEKLRASLFHPKAN